MKLTPKQRLEIGAYIVAIALAIPSYAFAQIANDGLLRDLLIGLSSTFAGAGFLFFLINRFFGLENDSTEKLEAIVRRLTKAQNILVTNDERRIFFPVTDVLNAAEQVRVLGNTAISFLDAHREIMAKRIRAGANIRLILIDPESKVSDILREVWEYSTFHSNIMKSLTIAREITTSVEKSGRPKGKFEVRFLGWIPSCTMIITDPHISTGRAIVSINNPNYSTPTTSRPHLILDKVKHLNWYTYYNDEFEKLWNQSRRVDYLTTK